MLSKPFAFRSGLLALMALTVGSRFLSASAAAEKAAAVEERLTSTIQYLASDELEGRGVGTKGIDLAADYIAEQFHQIGLKTDLFDGQPFQKFTIYSNSKLGAADKNTLSLVGPTDAKDGGKPAHLDFKLNTDFSPQSMGGSAKFDLPLVFAGYGITAPKLGYDDYAGLDVKGKAVIVVRHEPQQDDPNSVFDGTADSQYAAVARKIANAYEHGAEAVLLLTDEVEIERVAADGKKRLQQSIDELAHSSEELKNASPADAEQFEAKRKNVEQLGEQIRQRAKALADDRDPVFPFNHFRDENDPRSFPVIHLRTSAVNATVKAALGTDLATIEKQIDDGLKPHGGELAGWHIVGETNVQRVSTEIKNVIGVLEGEGPHADETIVIGAHYDHLGFGGQGSLARGVNAIHHGADDNASGTATVIEVARQLAAREKKLPRRVVFIAFSGEERGLLGSAHYVRDPLVPLEKTIAMLNMDMVGRLHDNKLIVYGNGTAPEWDPLLNRFNEKLNFEITRHPEGFGPSDHSSFYAKQVPVLHFFTGTHGDYHRPTDTADKINAEGMERVTELVTDIALAVAEADAGPKYQEVKGRARPDRQTDRPYFGSIPDFSQEKPGYVLMGVSKDGPAERAGIKAGDIIVQFGESRIGNLEDFDSALRKFKSGDRVPVTVKRGDEELKFEVTLEPSRG